MKARRHARMVALQVLYEVDSTTHPPATVLAHRLSEDPLPSTGEDFARKLVEGVIEHLTALDDMIRRYAPEWPLDQMAVVDRNILRIAIYELGPGQCSPLKVAINEAVELSKLFGSESSARFINGVLGTLVEHESGRVPGQV
ncbi:MAG: transcription antitermination factor NusB [Thermoflexales bacterium]|nr:transcription antitermination factor NusB [Thermoflexales bacterium]